MNVFSYYQSPLGTMTLQACDAGVLGAWFDTQTTRPDDLGLQDSSHPVLVNTTAQLEEYFSGARTSFDLPIASKGTAFQQQVWKALMTIPYGETWSYQDIANAIDNPKAVRAVGMANGKNPISIIVPCHRVIGKNGKLTGYAGGVGIKEKLLSLEGFL